VYYLDRTEAQSPPDAQLPQPPVRFLNALRTLGLFDARRASQIALPATSSVTIPGSST
jgi:hypothetical protein